MANLVSDHLGQLGFAVQVRQQPARDEDEASRIGKGVHRRVVEHVEFPRQVRTLGLGRHRRADAPHQCLDLRLRHLTDTLEITRRGFTSHLNFL